MKLKLMTRCGCLKILEQEKDAPIRRHIYQPLQERIPRIKLNEDYLDIEQERLFRLVDINYKEELLTYEEV